MGAKGLAARAVVSAIMVFCAVQLFQPGSALANDVYFDDSDPDLLKLGNTTYYEIGLSKTNGAITYITDKTTGENVSLGSRNGCLWGAVFFPGGTPEYVGGCSYAAGEANDFTYSWAPLTQTLTLDYTADPGAAQQMWAQVLIKASTESYFDMRLEVYHRWGSTLERVLFPSELVFEEADIEEVLLPILPGVLLKPGFFAEDRSYETRYPGYPGVFADYVSFDLTTGQLAMYALYGDGPIRPLTIGVLHDDEYVADSTFYYRAFGAWIPHNVGMTWPWIRVHISRPHEETIAAFRTDNGLDQFPSLTEKLGALEDQVSRLPLLRVVITRPFSEYAGVLDQVPWPGLLHPVAYQPGGHDQSYPDFLPPDPAWGTTEDLADMFEDAQAKGFLVMPYTNPTLWDDESPTLQNLPPTTTITDVAVLDEAGQPVYEMYGPNGGYVVSPYVPFVQQRVGEMVDEMTTDVPSDMLLEDQIGARPWLFDGNASSPHPLAYIEGWIEHVQAYSDTLLMTELAFDRLAEGEVGFHGSVLLPEAFGYTPDWWGDADNWESYPLAPMMARDKVLFYQHDLATETMTEDKAMLTWNLAYGYQLSFDISHPGDVDDAWLEVVGAFQSRALARYADEAMTGFAREGDHTRTEFETFTVVSNWDDSSTYAVGGYTIAPLGSLVTNTADSLTAGVFTAYNGEPLSAGDHYLIEERGADEIIIRQPMGADTALTLELLPAWHPGDPIAAWGYGAHDEMLAEVSVTVTGEGVEFLYDGELGGEPVSYYRVAKAPQVYLPLVLRSAP